MARDTPIMVMEAAGGLMTVETALAKPVHTYCRVRRGAWWPARILRD